MNRDSLEDDGRPAVGDLTHELLDEVAGLRVALSKKLAEALEVQQCLHLLLRQNQLISAACAAKYYPGAPTRRAWPCPCDQGVLTAPPVTNPNTYPRVPTRR
jgi:hypothetical protein